MSNNAKEFIEWLDQMEGGRMTDYELAKAGRFSHSVLSRARSGIPLPLVYSGKSGQIA